ncbi:MAG: DsbA family protein [Kofleriaceae bacterium]
MRHALLPLALVLLSPAAAIADRMVEAPPAKQSAAERIRELEQRVRDLERDLADARAQLARMAKTNTPPVRPQRAQLDTAKRYQVPLDDSPAMGPSRAPITIVAAVQFPEPYTHKAWPVLMQILKENRDVRIVAKSYIVHPKHGRSSIAACAAGLQGDLERMETAIYDAAQQPDPAATQPTYGLREITEGEAREIARGLRLNLAQYDRDLPTCEAGQQRDIAMFSALGQSAVPVFWINGRPLSGAQPIESFNTVIREERAAWKKAKAGGAPLDGYYEKVILQKPNPY